MFIVVVVLFLYFFYEVGLLTPFIALATRKLEFSLKAHSLSQRIPFLSTGYSPFIPHPSAALCMPRF
jgi:hypothetical protein